ncbi:MULTISPECIES: hypothetical protein [Catenuloplanes]|uniref:Uncharacterized protein n=1 Tax=Catenuloplanes niger TaxID=587534 RepID=A0AAE3ZRS1_9ACTN|nr:hypothetical protein [Catenuloplanes niger]MDR7323799.1 hypothetical protein [Catenuloplanes niger]
MNAGDHPARPGRDDDVGEPHDEAAAGTEAAASATIEALEPHAWNQRHVSADVVAFLERRWSFAEQSASHAHRSIVILLGFLASVGVLLALFVAAVLLVAVLINHLAVQLPTQLGLLLSLAGPGGLAGLTVTVCLCRR